MNSLDVYSWGLMIGQKVQQEIDGIITGTNVLIGTSQGEYLEFYDNDEYFLVHMRYCKPILREINNLTVNDVEDIVERFDLPKYITEEIYECSGEYVLMTIEDEFTKENVPMLHDVLTKKGYDMRKWITKGLAIEEKL